MLKTILTTAIIFTQLVMPMSVFANQIHHVASDTAKAGKMLYGPDKVIEDKQIREIFYARVKQKNLNRAQIDAIKSRPESFKLLTSKGYYTWLNTREVLRKQLKASSIYNANKGKFVDGGIEHIVFGEFNEATGLYTGGGLHSRQVFDELRKNRMIKIKDMTSPDNFGVVEVMVKKFNGDWTPAPGTNGAKSLFPSNWDEVKIMHEITYAKNGNLYFIEGNTWEGVASNGMKIRMFIDANTNKIISAFAKKQ